MTNETLMTEAATTTEGQASESTTDTSTGEGQPGQEQQQQQQQQQQPGADGQGQPDGHAESNGDEAKPKEPEGAPETYEFQAAEGTELDPQVLEQFSAVAKELNLPQDQAQKMIDKVAPVIQARQIEQIAAVQAQWAETSKADKEFGGDKLAENLATAKKALDTFGTPELRTLLKESGMGNNPEVIRFMFRTGKAISEDRFIPSGSSGASRDVDAKRLYPNSNMN